MITIISTAAAQQQEEEPWKGPGSSKLTIQIEEDIKEAFYQLKVVIECDNNLETGISCRNYRRAIMFVIFKYRD